MTAAHAPQSSVFIKSNNGVIIITARQMIVTCLAGIII